MVRLRRDIFIASLSAILSACVAIGVEELRYHNDRATSQTTSQVSIILRAQDAASAVETAAQPVFDDVYAQVAQHASFQVPTKDHSQQLSAAVGRAVGICESLQNTAVRTECERWVDMAGSPLSGLYDTPEQAQELRLAVDDGYAALMQGFADLLRGQPVK
jgi:hypothetical protein